MSFLSHQCRRRLKSISLIAPSLCLPCLSYYWLLLPQSFNLQLAIYIKEKYILINLKFKNIPFLLAMKCIMFLRLHMIWNWNKSPLSLYPIQQNQVNLKKYSRFIYDTISEPPLSLPLGIFLDMCCHLAGGDFRQHNN